MSQLSVVNEPIMLQRHSPQFKQQVAACAEPGASVAGIALAHSLNANMLRKWIHELNTANHAIDLLLAKVFICLTCWLNYFVRQ